MSDFLLYVDAARYPSGDDIMHIGFYALNPDGRASARYATFSAKRNLNAIITPYAYPYPPGSGRIAVCRPSSYSAPAGKWKQEGRVLSFQSGSIVHQYTQDADTPQLYRATNNWAKGSFLKGFGWRTPTLQATPKLGYDNFHGGYGVPGEWFGTSAAGRWELQGAGFNPYLFTAFNPSLWTYTTEDAGMNVYLGVLLNWLPKGFLPQSNLIFWDDPAHDFNRDNRAGNDYAHTIVGWACLDAETEMVECVLRMECSFEFDGQALAGVGYALP